MKSSSKHRFSILAVLIVTSGYLFVHMLWYSSTPMGIDPVLDGKQNLLTADKMYRGESFDDPFHRAPLYPYLISLVRKVNVWELQVPTLVRLLNGLAVLISTGFAAHLAWLIWKKRYAVWIAGICVGMNPVVAFFASDPLDISLATTCLTIVAWILYRGYKSRSFRWGFWLIGGLVLGIGMALRSHLMLVALMWPVLAGLATMRNRNTRKPNFIAIAFAIAIIGPILSLVLTGVANKSVSGEFRMTPWGGAYLLWAGNGPMNNGRYYAQTVRVEYEGSYDNPSKFESIHYYQQLTGEEPPHEISAMNFFFISETIKQIFADPRAWVNLMFRKLHSLLHNYEQYDNKTYSLQKSISPYLGINPIGWGLLITFATLGGLMLSFVRKTSFMGILSLVVLYSIMVLTTFTANRYRVPLIPLLAVLAAGVPKLYLRQDQFTRNEFIVLAFTGVLTAIVTFFPFFGVAEKDTYLADYALLANAAHRQGENEDAMRWANIALTIDSGRDDLREVALLSQFNKWFGNPDAVLSSEQAQSQLREFARIDRESAGLVFARGVYAWKLGDTSGACMQWKEAVDRYGHRASLEALVWNCDVSQDYLDGLPAAAWMEIMAIKNAEVGFKDSSGSPPLTAELINKRSEFYRNLYEPISIE